jgi:hypothetical protein
LFDCILRASIAKPNSDNSQRQNSKPKQRVKEETTFRGASFSSKAKEKIRAIDAYEKKKFP